MKIIFFTIISLIPVVLLGYYIYKKDTIKEPKTLLLGLFASGFLSAFIVVLVNILIVIFLSEYYLINMTNNYSRVVLFMIIFIEIALLEEFSKWLMIRIFGYKNKEFDQFYDIIIYSVFVSLGFATVENIFYIVPRASFAVGIFRAIFSVPAHAAFGVFMGYFFGLAKLSKNKFRYIMCMLSAFLIPTLLHAIYDFCLFIENIGYLIVFILFITALYVSAIIELNESVLKDM